MTQNRVISTLADSAIAGKNFIINGGFDFWQRGTTFTSPSSWTYSADRWLVGAFSGAIVMVHTL